MELYFGKDIEFCVFPDLNGPGSVRISIRYKDKEFSFEYYNILHNSSQLIFVVNLSHFFLIILKVSLV